MPKPFGKPAPRRFGLTRLMRLTVALWGAAIPAYFLCRWASDGYPTLAERPFFWPSTVAFVLFYAIAIALWLRRRPSPRGPWESTRTTLFIGRLLLGLMVALPVALLSALLYDPAFKLANGLASPGRGVEEIALVERQGSAVYLDSPYWAPGFRWKVPEKTFVPPDLASGSIARFKLRRGLLGALWVDGVEFTVLK